MADHRASSGIGETGNKAHAKVPSPWLVRGASRKARAKTSKTAARQHKNSVEWDTNALIFLVERAECGEERGAAVTRSLADLALSLETTLTRYNFLTAQSTNNSVVPFENAANAPGNRMSWAWLRATQEAPSVTTAQFFSTLGEPQI